MKIIIALFLILQLIVVNPCGISNKVVCCDNEPLNYRGDCCCYDKNGKVFTLYYRQRWYVRTFDTTGLNCLGCRHGYLCY